MIGPRGLVSEARCPLCRSELVPVCRLEVGAKGWAQCRNGPPAGRPGVRAGNCLWNGVPVISRIDGLYIEAARCGQCHGDGWAAGTSAHAPLEEYQPCRAAGCTDGERRRVELDRYRRALATEAR